MGKRAHCLLLAVIYLHGKGKSSPLRWLRGVSSVCWKWGTVSEHCSRALGYHRLLCCGEGCSSPLIMFTEFCWALSRLSMSLLHEEPRTGHGAPDVASPMLNKGRDQFPPPAANTFYFPLSSHECNCWCVASGINSPITLSQLWKKIVLQLENTYGIQIRESCMQKEQQNITLWLINISFLPSYCPTSRFPVKNSYFYLLHVTCCCWQLFSKPFSVEVISV